ncbi:trypsin-like cysteine/serine peptidase domain-containing protein [Gilbertella persicaria]|nr:trypsin-like cysteine/serine peptidase domain-containing protein [Gilbertella persicaria]KAI8086921.1 trypsin-like cysteine/serine peptidase domain-containing protein [Gilbertella persicaria]
MTHTLFFILLALTFVSGELLIDDIRTYDIPQPLITQNTTETLKPYRFGLSIPVSITNELPLLSQETVWQWRIKIHSSGALSLSFIFDQLWIPKGARVDIFNQNDRQQILTSQKTRFATKPMAGNTLFLEYTSPFLYPLPKIYLSRVVYGYRQVPFLKSLSFPGSNQRVISRNRHSGKCNIDYACDAMSTGWSKEASSVVVLLTDENQKYCTGAFINNVEQDGRQLLLTAYHCLTDTSNPATDMVLLNYQRQSCRTLNQLNRSPDILHGLVWLGGSNVSDFALFEVKEPIPDSYDVYLSGWTTEPEPHPPLTGIHHPSGDFKKISMYDGHLLPSCWDECPENDHWKVERWTYGTTESGSSGSPLFDAHHRIVGQLHGGVASCWYKNGYDMYGSFKDSWRLGLSDLLDPKHTQHGPLVYLNGVYLNDARNKKVMQS